jgi:hypothetical protein
MEIDRAPYSAVIERSPFTLPGGSGVAHRAGSLDKAVAYSKLPPGAIFMRRVHIRDRHRTVAKPTNAEI